MNPFQFLKEVQQMPNAGGDGFRRVIPMNSAADLRTAAGLVLTAATVPAVVNVETNALAVQSAAAATALGSFVFHVPKDYDNVADELFVNVLVNSAGTDVPTLTATAYRKRAGASLTAALTVVASAAVPNATAKAAVRQIKLSGNSLQADDVLTINLVTGAHATDAINLYSVEVQYKTNLVFSAQSAR